MKSLSRHEISLLSKAERLSLIGDLWDSLGDSDLALSDAQSNELRNRLDSFAADQPSAISWEDFQTKFAKHA